jgi:hypothetical protein
MSQRQRILFFAAVCALVLAMAGCSKSNSSSIATPSPTPSTNSEQAPAVPAASASNPVSQPCSLLTQAEVEGVLGKGATITPYANPRTGMDECKLKPASGSDLDQLVIVVHETTPESWGIVKKGFMTDKKVKQIHGLGDDAINVGGYAGIFARKGTKYVQIFGSLKPERDEQAELDLLKLAVSRL